MTTDQAYWAESSDRYTLEDGFTVAPVSSEMGGIALPELGWNIYAPNGQIFAWAHTPEEIAEKIERERRERIFSRRP